MRYYCERCGTVLEIGDDVNTHDFFEDALECYFCGMAHTLDRIPDYETPEQYKTRTGKQWPDNGPVWIMRDDEKEFLGGGFWGVCRYKTAKEMRDKIIVCIQGPQQPSDNWRPQ